MSLEDRMVVEEKVIRGENSRGKKVIRRENRRGGKSH